MKTATIEELRDLSSRLRNPNSPISLDERMMLADWLDASAREADELRAAAQSHIDYFAQNSIKQ